MKKKFATILAIASLMAFAPLTNAQGPVTKAEEPEDVVFPADNTIKFSKAEWEKEYDINTESKVAVRKIISKPNSQGVYHILLDAFATGSEAKVVNKVRSDIVLVLDVSGSMKDDMDGTEHSLGEAESKRRLTAMKTAVNSFIDLINADDIINPETGARIGNRVAIVPFASSLSSRGKNQVRDFRGLNNSTQIKRDINNLEAGGGTNAHLGMERALSLLTFSSAQVRTVVLFTDGDPGYFGLWTGTRETNWGPMQAWDYCYEWDVMLNERIYENTLSSANSVIDYASQIKNLATPKTNPDYNDPNKRIIANVFTVSIINNPSDFTNVYLGKASSNWEADTKNMGSYTISTNYPHTISGWNSTDIWANGKGTRAKIINAEGVETSEYETKYALTAQSTDDLINAFSTIAGSIGDNTGTLGESSVATVDVVSASFNLPKDADDSSIRVYTAKCEGMSGDQPIFGTLVLAPGRDEKFQPLTPGSQPKDVDDDIPANTHLGYSSEAQEATGKKDKITVEGFDYTGNWVGEVKNQGNHESWHGYKISILIPIKMNPDALGGVGVDTNDEEHSGIYVNGKNEFPFTSPKVNLPVNIIINKKGLDEGESSKFTIYRKTASETNWVPVTSVFVTRHKNQTKDEPRTRIEGLPATDPSGVEYIYMVKEDDWSWSYTLTSDAELTTEDNDNPFTFTNKKKNNIDVRIRHAESKVTNTFKTGGSAAYDDSKNNNRDVITVPTQTK